MSDTDAAAGSETDSESANSDDSASVNQTIASGEGSVAASSADDADATPADESPAATDNAEAPVTQTDDGPSLQGRKILMLGAGGGAKAIGWGVVRAGAELTIANRTHERAVALAEQLGCQSTVWGDRDLVDAEVIVNCTSVGMHPKVDDTPFVANYLDAGTFVFDTVYNPEDTLLLKQAQEHGCSTVSGIEMFVRQAAVQFERFTDQPAPLDVMREAVRRAISAAK